jgi:hypothetical protein
MVSAGLSVGRSESRPRSWWAPCREGECPSVMVSAAERSGAKSNQMAPWNGAMGVPKGTIHPGFLFSRDAISRIPRLRHGCAAAALGMTIDNLSPVAQPFVSAALRSFRLPQTMYVVFSRVTSIKKLPNQDRQFMLRSGLITHGLKQICPGGGLLIPYSMLIPSF